MNYGTAKKLCLAALAAGLLFAGSARAELPAPARLAAYAVALSSADPVAAVAFLKDGEARTLADRDGQKGADLTAKAQAVKDLKDLLAMPWDLAKANQLNQALAIRIDVDQPLTRMGVGPEPEKLLSWLAKFQPAYPAAKKAAVKKAIRQWDVVFGTMTSTRDMDWGQARNWNGVTISKTAWDGWVLRERNSVLERLMKTEASFQVYSDAMLASKRDELAVSAAMDKAISSGALSPAQLAQLDGKPFADKLYLLGSFFDGSNVAVSPDIKSRIQAARDSLPKEVLTAQQRDLLGGMLNTAVTKEISGTQAGKRVLAAGPLKIEVRPCDGAYSRYDPATGAIQLDSETIQQYMRLKGYTAESVMKSKAQLAEIAKYMSPAVVYEAGHKIQADWAKKQGVYKPHVQEDEIEAMSLEGLYTTEKLAKDPAFKKIMNEGRRASSYAAKKLEVATKYRKSGPKAFATSVRQLYFSGLPSLDAAASRLVGALSAELERRAALPAAEQAELAADGLTLGEAMEMGPDELAGSTGEIRTAALVKIQKDLMGLGVYRAHYNAAENDGRKALKTLKTSSTGRSSVPPLL